MKPISIIFYASLIKIYSQIWVTDLQTKPCQRLRFSLFASVAFTIFEHLNSALFFFMVGGWLVWVLGFSFHPLLVDRPPTIRHSFNDQKFAEATIPLRSPPTATGLPRNLGSAACSTDAKKASASRWMIIVSGAWGHFGKETQVALHGARVHHACTGDDEWLRWRCSYPLPFENSEDGNHDTLNHQLLGRN